MNIQMIPISEIEVKDRARVDFGEVGELANSIQQNGLINPITVSIDGRLVKLVAGERRLRAMALLKWDKVPCRIFEQLSPLERCLIELEENFRRKEMTWQEEVALIENIDKMHREIDPTWSVQKTADMLQLTKNRAMEYIQASRYMKKYPDLAKEKDKKSAVSKTKRLRQLELRKLAVEIGDSPSTREGEWSIISPLAKLWKGDCLDMLRSLPSESVDLIIADPPYGVDFGKGDVISRSWNSTYADSAGALANLISSLLSELFRVAKVGSHMYMFHPSPLTSEFASAAASAGFGVASMPLIWWKRMAGSIAPGSYYSPDYESFLYCWKGNPRRLGKMSGCVIDLPSVQGALKRHPAEKPINLLKFLVEQSSILGEIVVDPFGGSGSTAAACHELGRVCYTSEREEDWQAVIEERFMNYGNGG